MATTYEVYALCPGGRTVDWSSRLYLGPTGETTSAWFLWLLRGPAGPILVDTGFTGRLGKIKGVPVEELRLRTRDELLKTAGVDPTEVKTVILTHLHWDHFDLEGFLPKATFWVQRRELDFWNGVGGQDPWPRRFLSDCYDQDLGTLRSSGRLKVVDGNLELVEGVQLEWVGGHSPGMQIVVVQSAKGPFVIANDALTTFRNLRDWAPPAIHLNSIAECLGAMARIKQLSGGDEGRICPGHDGEVWKKFPEVKPGMYRLA